MGFLITFKKEKSARAARAQRARARGARDLHANRSSVRLLMFCCCRPKNRAVLLLLLLLLLLLFLLLLRTSTKSIFGPFREGPAEKARFRAGLVSQISAP